jgi:hypothetical protein
MKRRDFLKGVTVGAILAGLPVKLVPAEKLPPPEVLAEELPAKYLGRDHSADIMSYSSYDQLARAVRKEYLPSLKLNLNQESALLRGIRKNLIKERRKWKEQVNEYS